MQNRRVIRKQEYALNEFGFSEFGFGFSENELLTSGNLRIWISRILGFCRELKDGRFDMG